MPRILRVELRRTIVQTTELFVAVDDEAQDVVGYDDKVAAHLAASAEFPDGDYDSGTGDPGGAETAIEFAGVVDSAYAARASYRIVRAAAVASYDGGDAACGRIEPGGLAALSIRTD